MNRMACMTVAAVLLCAPWGSPALGHCQIPCGIYDDDTRLRLMDEHVTTIEKSMKQIRSLSEEKAPDWNQLVRWVQNKEDHADQLTEIATYYFMAQRVKPADESDQDGQAGYVKQLTLLHRIMVHAMKAKQTTDLEQVKILHDLIHRFRDAYVK